LPPAEKTPTFRIPTGFGAFFWTWHSTCFIESVCKKEVRIPNFLNFKPIGGNMEMPGKFHFSNIIGHSDAIKEVFALMEQAIDSNSDVLITGETGTGKELVAKGIHIT